MDEKLALSAAHKSIAQLKAMTAVNGSHDRADVARVLRKGFDTHRKMLSRNRPTEMSETLLSFPAGTDFATWQKFYRSSSDAEVTAVILTRILGFSEAAVAEGFNVSSGTMKYRVAKGVRQLGSVLAKAGIAV
jgi:DNA-directed RNA polymerase specialized sigma24 family protein